MGLVVVVVVIVRLGGTEGLVEEEERYSGGKGPPLRSVARQPKNCTDARAEMV